LRVENLVLGKTREFHRKDNRLRNSQENSAERTRINKKIKASNMTYLSGTFSTKMTCHSRVHYPPREVNRAFWKCKNISKTLNWKK
jgi:hypothetical protein